MLNKVMLIGRVGQDPELRYTQSGIPMLNLSVATDESYTDRDGNRQERTEWHRIVVYDRLAENCSTYLHKGSLVFVEGSLQTRKWQDKEGQNRTSTDIRAQRVQFLDRKGDVRPDGDYAQPDRDAPSSRNAPRQRERDSQNWRQADRGPSRQRTATAPEPRQEAYPSEGGDMDDGVVPF